MTPDTVQPGDRAPFYYGMAADQSFTSSDHQAGRPAALILAGVLPPETVSDLMAAFADRSEALDRLGADALVLASAGGRSWIGFAPPCPGPRLVHCASAEVFAEIERPTVLVVDRSQHVAARLDGGDADAVADQALAAISAMPREPPREVAACAPVLIVPDLIDPALRRDLIAHFEDGAQASGALASIDAHGQAVSRIDEDKKRRRDCTLEPSSPIHQRVVDVLARRLAPDIKRAFQIDVAHIDRVLIARYDHTGGYFRRHRDNTAPQVAFRQFAVSLNLNTGDYEGGHLLFPEFTDHRYNPPAGAAIVFSASLLHEAAPVTRGSRYVLLTFLHDEAAEMRRQAQVQTQVEAAGVKAA